MGLVPMAMSDDDESDDGENNADDEEVCAPAGPPGAHPHAATPAGAAGAVLGDALPST